MSGFGYDKLSQQTGWICHSSNPIKNTSKQEPLVRLKQLTIYPIAYGADWMDEMDVCHIGWFVCL